MISTAYQTHKDNETAVSKTENRTTEGPDDPGNSSSSSSSDLEPDTRAWTDRSQRDAGNETTIAPGSSNPVPQHVDPRLEGRVRGVNNIINGLQGQRTLADVNAHDLETVAAQYRNLAQIFDENLVEKSKEMCVMMVWTTLALFTRKESGCTTHEDGLQLLCVWYDSSEKQGCILAEWKDLCLSHTIEEKPDESEVVVFRSFVAKVMNL